MRAGGLLRYLFYCGVFGREVAEMKMVGETGGGSGSGCCAGRVGDDAAGESRQVRRRERLGRRKSAASEVVRGGVHG